jgi:hypothetical protein
VSLIPAHLQARRDATSFVILFFFSLTTDVNPVSPDPQVSVSTKHNTPMVRITIHYFLLLAIGEFPGPFLFSPWLL